MKEQYISYEVAKLAAEKGFDEPCLYYYDSNKHIQITPNRCYVKMSLMRSSDINMYTNCIIAPTQSMLAKWLRENHNRYIEIILCNNTKFTYRICSVTRIGTIDAQGEILQLKSYEEAMEHALKIVLKII